jgi:hypothetical protein
MPVEKIVLFIIIKEKSWEGDRGLNFYRFNGGVLRQMLMFIGSHFF